MRDFAPVAFVGYTPTLLVVAADSPVKSLKDLAALAARPEGVTFASAGNGTSGHLAGEMLAQRLGGKMIHVPYKEGAVALTSVMSRQVDFMFYHPAAVMPQIKAGKLRALGASGAVRSAAAPDVPTLMEQGVADFDLVAWFMLYAPAATPAGDARRSCASASTAALAAAARRWQRLREQGVEQRPMRADEMAPFNQDRDRQVGRARQALRRAGRLSTRSEAPVPNNQTTTKGDRTMRPLATHPPPRARRGARARRFAGAGVRAGHGRRAGAHRQHARPHRAARRRRRRSTRSSARSTSSSSTSAAACSAARSSGSSRTISRKPDLARTLYEQLVTADKVDLLMGPYATGAILSAMGVAQRYNKVLVHHTLGIPSLAKYDMQFPAWSLGSEPRRHGAEHLVRRARRAAQAAEDGRRRHQQVPVDPVHERGRARGAEEARPHGGAVPRMGLRQPRLRPDRQPHQGRQARLRLGRRDRPRRQPAARCDEEDRLRAAAALLPLPGAGSAGLAAGGEERALGDDLRGPAAVHVNPGAAEFVKLYRERATKAGLADPSVETQAAASYTAWQILEAGVVATKSLDDKAIATWLKANRSTRSRASSASTAPATSATT